MQAIITTVVSSKEIFESPRLCLSPLRAFKWCHKCPVFVETARRIAKKQGIPDWRMIPIEQIINALSEGPTIKKVFGEEVILPSAEWQCNPKVAEEFKEAWNKRAELLIKMHYKAIREQAEIEELEKILKE